MSGPLPGPVTVPDIVRKKERGEKIVMLTAYDAPTARLLDSAGVDILLVSPHWLRGTSLRENALDAGGNRIGPERRAHTHESVALDECSRRILGAMKKRKRELVLPGRIRALFLLHLMAPRLAERIIRRKIAGQK